MTLTTAQRRELDSLLPAGTTRQTGERAHRYLRAGFTVAPVLAGLDKFSDRMVAWEDYLAPVIARRLPVSPRTFMKVVGAVEITGGLLVAMRPSLGGRIVGLWLGGIIGNLLLHPRRYLDIALRDLGLAIGAFSLASLDDELREERRQGRQRRPSLTQEGAVHMPQRLHPNLEEAPSPAH